MEIGEKKVKLKEERENPMPQIQPLEFHANLPLKWGKNSKGKSPRSGQKEEGEGETKNLFQIDYPSEVKNVGEFC